MCVSTEFILSIFSFYIGMSTFSHENRSIARESAKIINYTQSIWKIRKNEEKNEKGKKGEVN